MSSTALTLRDHVTRWLPPLGTAALIAWMLASTDLDAAVAAFAAADLTRTAVVLVVGVLATWAADVFCIRWLLARTLGPAAAGDSLGVWPLARIKAASYVLNIVNYNAATLGMAWIIGRRGGVGFVRATAALAVLSWLDLMALALLVSVGLAAAPWVLGDDEALQQAVASLAIAVPTVAVVALVVARLAGRWRWLSDLACSGAGEAGPPSLLRQRLARLSLDVLKPLGSLRLADTALGVAMRAGFVLLYVGINQLLMTAFGLHPRVEELLVLVPVMAIVGVVPLSISGIGTTQLLARVLYARFVPAGVAAAPLIDAYTTSMILGFILVRLVVAAPFVAAIGREIEASRPDRRGERGL